MPAPYPPYLREALRADYATGAYLQAELAVKYGVHQATVTNWCSGMSRNSRLYYERIIDGEARIRERDAAYAATGAGMFDPNVLLLGDPIPPRSALHRREPPPPRFPGVTLPERAIIPLKHATMDLQA